MAFFVPRKAPVCESRGAAGQLYYFTREVPVEVKDERDAAKFRNQRDILMEVDGPTAQPAEQPRESAEAATIRPPAPSSESTAITTKDLSPKGGPEAKKPEAKETKKVSRKAKK